MIRYIQRLLMLGVSLIALGSCNYETPTEEVESMVGVELRRKIKFIDREDQWMGPDGYKIETFEVVDPQVIPVSAMQSYDSLFVEQHYRSSELYPYVESTAGYYLHVEEDNTYKHLFYDTVNQRMTYMLEIL